MSKRLPSGTTRAARRPRKGPGWGWAHPVASGAPARLRAGSAPAWGALGRARVPEASLLASSPPTWRPAEPPASPGPRQRAAEPLRGSRRAPRGRVDGGRPAALTSPARARSQAPATATGGARPPPRDLPGLAAALLPLPAAGVSSGAPLYAGSPPFCPTVKPPSRAVLGPRGLSPAHPSASGPRAPGGLPAHRKPRDPQPG